MSKIAPRGRGGRWVIVPGATDPILQRRAERATRARRVRILWLLLALASGSGIWAITAGTGALATHLAVDVITLFYGSLMYQSRRRRLERTRKVRALARHPLSAQRAWNDDGESVAL